MFSKGLAKVLQWLLTVRASEVARESNCFQRDGKLGGAGLVQTLVFGYLRRPRATCEELAQTANSLGYAVSPQAVDQRCTAQTSHCLQQLAEEAVQQVITAEPALCPLLQKFSAVELLDSTTVTLPDALAERWPGCGTNSPQGGQAALKVQTRLDFLGGRLRLQFDSGRSSDYRTPLQTEDLRRHSLHLRDLGYFELDTLATIDQRQAYYVSRLQQGTAVYDDQEQRLDLVKFLRQQTGQVVDLRVRLGSQHRLACRLVAVRLPKQIAAKRRRKLLKKAQKKGYTPQAATLELRGWSIYVTNAPVTLLSVEEVVALMRLRWQIELLFKLWKRDGGLTFTRSERPERILCEIFAKLLAMIVQHWVLLQTCWSDVSRSLRKAAGAVRAFGMTLATSFRQTAEFEHVVECLRATLQRTARTNRRKKHPAAFQVVTDPSTYGYKLSP